jgi:flagellar hook-basal body complex protein FliE
MSASSHQAELSSVRSQLGEMQARVEAIALAYQGTPDSSVAAELFEAERSLVTAGRVIDRALTALSELAETGR